MESGCSLMVRSAQRRGARGRAPRRPAAPAAYLPADGDIEEHHRVVGVGRQRRHDGRLTRKRKRSGGRRGYAPSSGRKLLYA